MAEGIEDSYRSKTPNALPYNMSHKFRGHALIFYYQYNYTNASLKIHSDLIGLYNTLKSLKFNVTIFADLGKDEILLELNKMSNLDHSHNDCILIVILSHCKPSALFGCYFTLEDITNFFTPDKCPSLAGKPKLFFILARGYNRIFEGVPIDSHIKMYDISTTNSKITIQADFLIAFAAMPVNYSIFSGTMFFRSLCEQLRKNGTRVDILQLLTNIIQEMSKTLKATVLKKRNKEIPFIESRLTRSLTFTENHEELMLQTEPELAKHEAKLEQERPEKTLALQQTEIEDVNILKECLIIEQNSRRQIRQKQKKALQLTEKNATIQQKMADEELRVKLKNEEQLKELQAERMKLEADKLTINQEKLALEEEKSKIAEEQQIRHAEKYDMSHKKRGFAIIFNQEHFDITGVDSRPGRRIDCDNLHETLKSLDFDVQVHNDLRCEEIWEIIEQMSGTADHTDNDCILIAELSHGDMGYFYAKDGPFKFEQLYGPFTADKCPSLAGKPKLFVIQACQGELADPGVMIVRRAQADGVVSTLNFKIPVRADFLIICSTVFSYKAFRNTTDGSWFVQSSCEQLRKNGRRYDIMRLLTLVNQKVATDFEVTGDPWLVGKKQIPCTTHMLTRMLYFNDKLHSTHQ